MSVSKKSTKTHTTDQVLTNVAPALNKVEINKAVEILNNAERPVIYAGFGGVGAGDIITELSRMIKAPIITTGKNFEVFEWNYEGLTGSAYRVGWKPANEVVFEALPWFKLPICRTLR